MDIRPIRTEADYEATLAEVELLMDAEPGSPDSDRLDVLATLVAAYEKKHYPIPPPDPIAAIEYEMEKRGLSRHDLEPALGGSGRVSEILNRKRPLTLKMIREVRTRYGIAADILVTPYLLADTK